MSKTIIITGTSGSGESPTTTKLAETLNDTWALIIQDDVRSFVKAGYRSAVEPWTSKTEVQWAVSIKICSEIIKYIINQKLTAW